MNALGLFVCGVGATAGLSLLRGLVFQALWTWFIVAQFGVAPVTLAEAIGICLIASFLTYQFDARESKDDDRRMSERLLAAVVTGLLINATIYGMGAVVHALAVS